ncbi:cora metal ion transporter [Heterobasidion irregulare TC 32-1]|uniref:Cora metal ion transporter n=1 Tax=Heterobasidion irregulare (strain TC 32-1) TaxID=747525 RepID=W4JYZ5_HETIT|nr:cora metal ion transporter [Heterobasidion irregulare TC 32-1]ETW78285.1 cora metal ion transporter [Heterobasidion irregulare TC 32-1]
MCRKKVMGLLSGSCASWATRMMSSRGLQSSATRTCLSHDEKILSRSHSNYLAQIPIEITDISNQINGVLSKLTALGTVLIPTNLVTGASHSHSHSHSHQVVAP